MSVSRLEKSTQINTLTTEVEQPTLKETFGLLHHLNALDDYLPAGWNMGNMTHDLDPRRVKVDFSTCRAATNQTYSEVHLSGQCLPRMYHFARPHRSCKGQSLSARNASWGRVQVIYFSQQHLFPFHVSNWHTERHQSKSDLRCMMFQRIVLPS